LHSNFHEAQLGARLGIGPAKRDRFAAVDKNGPLVRG
jgi:hypothetical protein